MVIPAPKALWEEMQRVRAFAIGIAAINRRSFRQADLWVIGVGLNDASVTRLVFNVIIACASWSGETQGARDGNRKNRLPTQTGGYSTIPHPAAQKILPYNAFCVVYILV